MKTKHLKLSFEAGGKTLRVTINRPEVRNVFNAELIADFQSVFSAITNADTEEFAKVRAVLLHGAGSAFCGGGDLNWMGASMNLSHAENLADCQRLTHMFLTMDRCPVPVVGLVH
ncbi:MAG: enoyl-CoA hydratase-related protein, partial [Bdellovibrionota bacterium]